MLNVKTIIIVIGKPKLVLYLELKKKKTVQFHEPFDVATEAAPALPSSPVYPYN